jgi:hypothetical protein
VFACIRVDNVTHAALGLLLLVWFLHTRHATAMVPVALLCLDVFNTDNTTAEGLQGLQARINELRDAEGPSPAAAGVGSSSSWGPSSSFDQQSPSSSSTDSTAADLYADYDGFDNATGSFSDAEDSEVSAALSRRIKQIATTTGEWGSSVDEEEMRQPLTGEVSVTWGRGGSPHLQEGGAECCSMCSQPSWLQWDTK